MAEAEDAAARWQRFAPYFVKPLPETLPTGGSMVPKDETDICYRTGKTYI